VKIYLVRNGACKPAVSGMWIGKIQIKWNFQETGELHLMPLIVLWLRLRSVYWLLDNGSIKTFTRKSVHSYNGCKWQQIFPRSLFKTSSDQ